MKRRGVEIILVNRQLKTGHIETLRGIRTDINFHKTIIGQSLATRGLTYGTLELEKVFRSRARIVSTISWARSRHVDLWLNFLRFANSQAVEEP